ncbi:MAG: carboxypeptidase-like regulatory domain-containing protein, partial [Longimicrobiales bacterium]
MRRRTVTLMTVLMVLAPAWVRAQSINAAGRVTDQAGLPLPLVRVVEKGTLNETLTNGQGRYELRGLRGPAVLVFTRAGYREEERPAAAMVNVSLSEAIALGSLEGVGTRRVDRAPTNTPLPVDIIDLPSVTQASGQLDLNQLLQ